MRHSHISRGAISSENARRRMMLTGFTPNGHPLWNGIEERNARLYPDYQAALALNTRRTLVAHYGKIGRMGIALPRSPDWSDVEILRLRRLYRSASKADLLTALPKRTWPAICRKASALKLRRPLRQLKPTGHFLLDQIRARAQQWGISMRALDEDTGGAGYFAKGKWRSGRIAPVLLARAVSVLGGQLRFRLNAKA